MEHRDRDPLGSSPRAADRPTGVPRLPSAAAAALAAAGLDPVTDPDVLTGHCRDWTGRWSGAALGMVRPRSTAQVAAVLEAATASGLPVQIQGGNTGLVGGSVPGPLPALLLLTTGLDRMEAVDESERTVVAGAGVPAAAVAAHAAQAGLHFGVDLASRDSATIGGMVATNAGGIEVLAYGMMREQVRGLSAVLADGRVIRQVRRPRKDNAGIDIGALLIGSEGTLGVITEVEIALHPARAATSVALLAADSLAAAIASARRVQSDHSVLAAEVVDSAGVALAAGALAATDPLPAGCPWLLLLEVADGATGVGLQPVGEQVLALGTTTRDRKRLWAFRERQTELRAAASGTDLERLDVSWRLERLDEAVAAIRAVVACAADGGSPAVGFFGHALDGNLHVQLVGAAPELADAVLAVVARMGGSISAEHGIGRQKSAHLPLIRTREEIGWMRQVRSTADPHGLLNPGVLFQ